MLDPIDILQPVTAPSEAMAGIIATRYAKKHELVCSGSASAARTGGLPSHDDSPKLSCLSCGYRHELPVPSASSW